MLRDIRTAAVTVLPLLITALALWALHALYQNHFFADLSSAKSAAFIGMICVHLFAPIWAATRPKWLSAAFAQIVLVGVNDLLFLQLALTSPHDASPPGCGLGWAFLCLGTFFGFVLFIPITVLSARTIHRGLNQN